MEESVVQVIKKQHVQDDASSDSGQSLNSYNSNDQDHMKNVQINEDENIADQVPSLIQSQTKDQLSRNYPKEQTRFSTTKENESKVEPQKIQTKIQETQPNSIINNEVREKQPSDPNLKQTIIQKKEQKPKKKDKGQNDEMIELIRSYDDQWDAQKIQSDDDQEAIQDEDEAQQNQNEQTTAFLEDEDIKNLSQLDQQQQGMNEAFIGKQTSIKYQHWVENKHLLVLYLLFRKQIYDLFPKKQYNRIDIHPANKNKIRIFGTTQEEVKEVSSKISQIINSIAILKLNIKYEEAVRLKSSQLLNKKLLKDKLVIFRFGNQGDKSYYLGGKGTQPHLATVFKDIRNLKFRYFRMFDYPNTRSYKIILGNIIKQKQFLKAFSKWNLKNLELVPYIPNFSGGNKKKQEQKSLCFLMTTIGVFENFSPKEIENNLAPYIKNNFYSIVLIFKKGDKYQPKLTVEGVTFKYVPQKKLPWSYLYIMTLKKTYFQKRQLIIKQVEKLAEKRIIFGARFFNHISPQKSEYIKPEIYKEVKYPKEEGRQPYSYSIIAGEIKERIEKEKVQEIEEKEKIGENESEPKKYHRFDWKQHLLNFQSTELSFIQENKV